MGTFGKPEGFGAASRIPGQNLPEDSVGQDVTAPVSGEPKPARPGCFLR